MDRGLRWCLAGGILLLLVGVLGSPRAGAISFVQDAVIDFNLGQYVRVHGVAVGDTDGDGENEIVANYDWYSGSGNPRLVFYTWNGSAYTLRDAVDGVSLARQGIVVFQSPEVEAGRVIIHTNDAL